MSRFNRIAFAAVATTMMLSCSVYADKPASVPHGKGMGKIKPMKRSTTILPGATPPGLKKQPYGLMKQGKTPSGWTKGIKKGWRCNTAIGGARTCYDHLNHKKSCHVVNGIWFCQ